jgi:hypothetical protein
MNISWFLIGFQKVLSDMSEFLHILGLEQLRRTYLGPKPGSSNPSQTCSALGPDMFSLPSASQQLSPSRPYPGFRELSQTCPTPNLDMPSFSALTRVKSRNWTCLVPRLGSRDLGQTCPAPSLDMSRSLTPPTGIFPLVAIKGPHASLAPLALQFNLKTL